MVEGSFKSLHRVLQALSSKCYVCCLGSIIWPYENANQ